MAATAKNFPYPVSSDGRPHIDQDLARLASTIETLLGSFTDAELALLAGADLFDSRLAFQSNTGTGRKWRGLYEYLASVPAWRSLIPVGAQAAWTPALTAASGNPNIGTTGTAVGWYAEMGALITGRGLITFGGTGITAGTGTWFVSLPVAHGYGAVAHPVGRGYYLDTPPFNTALFMGQLAVETSTTCRITGSAGLMASTTVDAPGASSTIDYQFLYRRA